jgi:hypothetical protein
MRFVRLALILCALSAVPSTAARIIWLEPIYGTFEWHGVWYPPEPGVDHQSFGRYWGPENFAFYTSEVEARFADDPALASAVCAWVPMVTPTSGDGKTEPLRTWLLERCRSVPLSVDARYRALNALFAPKAPPGITDPEQKRLLAGQIWLNRRFAYEIEISESISDDERRSLFNRTVTVAQEASRQPRDRFAFGLRALALRPQDDTAAYLLVRNLDAVRYVMNPPIAAEEARAFVLTQYSERAQSKKPAAADWMRGLAAFHFYSGNYDEALALARQLVKLPPSDHRSRDEILLALLERVKGDGSRLDKLRENCPKPDLAYVETRGLPRDPRSFCNEVIATLSARSLEISGEAAPGELLQTYVATVSTPGTSREQPLERPGQQSVAASPPRQKQIPHLGEYSAIVNRAIEETRNFTEAQRRDLEWQIFLRSTERDSALRALGVRPSYLAVQWILRSMRLGVFPEADAQYTEMRQAIGQLIRTHAAADGERAAEWQKPLIAYLLYTGATSEALEIARKRLAAAGSGAEAYDRVVHAVLERIHGDDKPYRTLLANCPPAPPSHVERFGRPASAQLYCLETLTALADHITLHHGRRTPAPVVEMIGELIAAWPLSSDQPIRLMRALGRADSAAASRRFEELLDNRAASPETRLEAIRGLREEAERVEDFHRAFAWSDLWMETVGFRPPPFTTAAWSAFLPKRDLAIGQRNPSEIESELIAKIRNAIRSEADAVARQAFEMLAGVALVTETPVALIPNLVYFGQTLSERGRHEEAKRIFGYVENWRSISWVEPMLPQWRERYGSGREHPLPLATSPWESIEIPLSERPADVSL